jgi:hypothetical protein
MINLTRKHKGGIIKKIRIHETGDQFPKYNGKDDIFTILIKSCATSPEYADEAGRCKIQWLKLPKKCCKWGIPTTWNSMSKNKSPPYTYWFLGDGDYKVEFLE